MGNRKDLRVLFLMISVLFQRLEEATILTLYMLQKKVAT